MSDKDTVIELYAKKSKGKILWEWGQVQYSVEEDDLDTSFDKESCLWGSGSVGLCTDIDFRCICCPDGFSWRLEVDDSHSVDEKHWFI